MNDTQATPRVWDDERDGRFFRITAACFPPLFCEGASVLLASYDSEDWSEVIELVTDRPLGPVEGVFILEPSTPLL